MGATFTLSIGAMVLINELHALFTQKPRRGGRAMAREEQRTGKSRELLAQEARQALPDLEPDKYNFAVCGPSRSGKSTIVNVLQGVKDGEPGAAEVGESETTMRITSYPIRNSHLVVWDLPGCGTERHPFRGYFESKKLYAFDGLILTYNSGLDENTVALYRQCMERQVPVMLVRTQADKAFDAKTRRMSPEQAIAEMKADFAKELASLGLDESTKAFYVSMWDLVSDEPRMDEQAFLETVLQFGRQRAGNLPTDVVAPTVAAVPIAAAPVAATPIVTAAPTVTAAPLVRAAPLVPAVRPARPVTAAPTAAEPTATAVPPTTAAQTAAAAPTTVATLTATVASTTIATNLVQKVRQSPKGLDPSKRNIVVCGRSRSGNSTVVNVLQGVAEGDPGAAPVHELECTLETTSYPVRDSGLVVWDLPGFGTERHPLRGYFEDKMLYTFDEIILTYSSGLDEDTRTLYRQCVECQVPVMLVCTHADKVFALKTRRMTPTQAIAEMRDEFAKELASVGLVEPTRAFYVSMWDQVDGKSKMDEQKFVQLALKSSTQ